MQVIINSFGTSVHAKSGTFKVTNQEGSAKI